MSQEPNDRTVARHGDQKPDGTHSTDAENLSRHVNAQLHHHPHKHHPDHKHHVLHGKVSTDSAAPHLQDVQITGADGKTSTVHKVEKGDNLTRIAKGALGKDATQQDIDRAIREIARENHIKNPNIILPGQQIKLPDFSGKHETPQPQPRPGDAPPQARRPAEQSPAAPIERTPPAGRAPAAPGDTTARPADRAPAAPRDNTPAQPAGRTPAPGDGTAPKPVERTPAPPADGNPPKPAERIPTTPGDGPPGKPPDQAPVPRERQPEPATPTARPGDRQPANPPEQAPDSNPHRPFRIAPVDPLGEKPPARTPENPLPGGDNGRPVAPGDTPPKLPGDQPPQPRPTDAPPSTTPPPAHLDRAALEKAAQDIHDAAFHRNLGGHGWSAPDAAPIKTIIGTMNEADRAALQQVYEGKFHSKMQGDVHSQFKDDAVSRSEIDALMARKDGKSDEAGQIHNALAKLEVSGAASNGDATSDASRAEGQIRNSLSTMTARQIDDLKKTYQQNYGKPLADALNEDPNLSAESKKAIGIYLNGIDKRTPADTAKLADIGLSSKRLDIFQESMEYASPAARQAFLANGGDKKIDAAFGGSDAKIAHDYAKTGAISLTTLVDGDSHFWHTNKDEINRAVENVSSDERAKFQLGKKLADANVTPLNETQRDAIKLYHDTETALQGAGNAREAQMWTAKLNGSESIVNNVLQTQHDGFLGIGKGHDKGDLFGAVENISPEDWKSLKDHPEHLRDVQAALATVSDGAERARLNDMLQDKLRANTFADSQNMGRRSINESLTDAGTDPSKQVDALLHMSATERQSYAANTSGFADSLDRQVNGGVKSDGARVAARDVLSQVKAGQEPKLSALDRVALGSERTDNPVGTVNDIEVAFKADPSLLGRIKNPQNGQDEQLAKVFQGALNNAVDKAGYGAQSYGDGGYSESQYPDFAKNLLDTGHLPIDQKIQLSNGDKSATLGILQGATADEKAALLNPNPDAKTKALQDAVLGNGPERSLYQNVLSQGKLTDADQMRAYALGVGGDSASSLQRLSQMNPDQKQALANEYFQKYGSLVSEDVVAKAKDSEKFRFTELLSPTDQNVRQMALDARVENDRHNSSLDGVMRGAWDYSGVAAQESSRQMEKFVAQHAAEIDNLSPEQHKQFDSAVANYMQAQQNYIDSKGAASEAVVDAAITVAAVGGAAFTGGTSLALLGAIGAGGAVFRVGAMRAMEGTDFDSSAHGVLEQAFKGGSSAMLGFVGPELFGVKGLAAVGEAAAARTSVSVMEKAAQHGLEQSAFRGGEDATKKTIAEGVAALTRREAIAGEQGTDAAIKGIANKVLADGATAEQRAALEGTIRDELRTQVTKTLRDKLINEGESAFLNVATASGANVSTEVASTAVGLSDPKTLFDRMQQAAISGAAGAAMFHVAFRAAAGLNGLRASVGKDADGLFAGGGTKVRHADGTETTVKADEKYRFKTGDQIVEREKAGTDDADSTLPLRTAANVTPKPGETTRARSETPERVDPEKTIRIAKPLKETPETFDPEKTIRTSRPQRETPQTGDPDKTVIIKKPRVETARTDDADKTVIIKKPRAETPRTDDADKTVIIKKPRAETPRTDDADKTVIMKKPRVETPRADDADKTVRFNRPRVESPRTNEDQTVRINRSEQQGPRSGDTQLPKQGASGDAASTGGTERPSWYSKSWTDTTGRQWSRDGLMDSKWQSPDGSTYESSGTKEHWKYADGRERLVYKSGQEYNFDPKTSSWTDHEGTRILTLTDRTIQTKTDGTKIETLKDGTQITTKNLFDVRNGKMVHGDTVEVTNNGRSTVYETSKPPNSEIQKITEPNGRVLTRVDANHFQESFPQGDARVPKVVESNFRLGTDGKLVSNDGIVETTIAPDGKVERHSAPEIFQQFGQVSEKFREKADRTLLDLPPEIRRLLADKKAKIVIGNTVPEVRPDLKGVQPRGHEPGGTWDNVEGLYSPHNKQAIVTENRSNGKLVPSNRVEGVLRHEIGHAVDHALGDFRNSPEFRAAYKADRARIDATFSAKEKEELKYYLQMDAVSRSRNAGRSEAFAELFGLKFGGGGQYWSRALIEKAFPDTLRTIDTRLEQLRQTGK